MHARPWASALLLALIVAPACAHREPQPYGAQTEPRHGTDELQFPFTWCDGPAEAPHRLHALAVGPASQQQNLPQLRDIARIVAHDAALAIAATCAASTCPARVAALRQRLGELSLDASLAIGHVTMAPEKSYGFRFIVGTTAPAVLIVCSDTACQLAVDVVPERVRYNYATDTSIGAIPDCRHRKNRFEFFVPSTDERLDDDALGAALR